MPIDLDFTKSLDDDHPLNVVVNALGTLTTKERNAVLVELASYRHHWFTEDVRVAVAANGPHPMDFELHPCRTVRVDGSHWNDPNGEVDRCALRQAQFLTLYRRMPDGTVEAVRDFPIVADHIQQTPDSRQPAKTIAANLNISEFLNAAASCINAANSETTEGMVLLESMEQARDVLETAIKVYDASNVTETVNVKLAEVVYDITTQVEFRNRRAGRSEERNHILGEDSRERFQTIMAWAQEFERQYDGIVWGEGENDYLIAIDEFTDAKLKEIRQ